MIDRRYYKKTETDTGGDAVGIIRNIRELLSDDINPDEEAMIECGFIPKKRVKKEDEMI